MMLRSVIDAWPTATLGQRLEDARMLLSIHGFIRESENTRIKSAIKRRWDNELTKQPTGSALPPAPGQHAKDALPPSSSGGEEEHPFLGPLLHVAEVGLSVDGISATDSGEDALPPAPEGSPEPTRGITIRICNACYELKGEMCHEPECVFCRRTMAEVGEILDVLLIRPVIDGERYDLHPIAPEPDASPAKEERHSDTCAGHDGLRYCDCGVDAAKYPSHYAQGGPEPDWVKVQKDWAVREADASHGKTPTPPELSGEGAKS